MIKLRDYKKEDVERLVQLANNKNVSRYLIDTFPFPYTKEDAEWWIETGSKENNAVTKVIEYNSELVGSIGITPQAGWRNHIAEIGYWLGEDYWGQGIASAALKEMVHQVFAAKQYSKLFAPVLEPNKVSMKVLEKNGFVLEGILKQEVTKDGQRYDVHHWSLIDKT